MSTPYVVAATIAKNRAWSLLEWYFSLRTQDKVPNATFVLLNDCSDFSESLMSDLSFAAGSRWDERLYDLHFEVINTGDHGYDRIYPRYSTANLATLRNEMMDRVLARWPQCTHVWSVDSDVLPDPDVLEKLLEANLPVVAAVVANNATGAVFNFFGGSDDDGPRRAGLDVMALTFNTSPFEVTMTGACVLISRDVLDAGVRYADHPRGEDVAWSVSARNAGFPLHVHPLARTRHIQRDGSEWR